MSDQDPFSILGIAPTAEPALIKRAYFAALVHHPPHADAEGFRRVRAAYETLSDPQMRTLALLRAPIDASAELATFEAAWGARLAQVASLARTTQRHERAVGAFVEHISRLTFTQVRARR